MGARFTPTRLTTVAGFLAAAVLGPAVWGAHSRLERLEREVAHDAPLVVRSIQELAVEWQQLQDRLAADGLVRLEDPEQYVREIAIEDAVAIGDVDITPSARPSGAGVEDHRFRVQPTDARRAFRLDSISNFLFRLEEASESARITELRLEVLGGQRPHEVGDPRQWIFSTTLTSRQAAR